MNCVIYARVSTDQQAERDLSIPAQLQATRDYARQHGWVVVAEFVEPGVSARTTERPSLQRMLAMVRDRDAKVGVVLVHKIDRLARNVADHATIRALLNQLRIRLASVVENVDDSVSGQLVENIMASIAQYFSANLGEETKKGMRQKVLGGGWPHKPPRGFVTVNGMPNSRIEVHPRIGPLVRQAFELYATGFYSIDAVARRLETQGLVTKRGHRLAKSELHRMLTNSFYVGRVKWKELEVEGSHPKLVPQQLFDKVQATIAARFRAPGGRRLSGGLPLRGLAVCASCRGRMTGEWHGRWAYYRCCRRTYQRERCAARMCNAKRVHADLRRICLQTQITRALADKIQKAAVDLVRARTSAERHSELDRGQADLNVAESELAKSFIANELTTEAYRMKTDQMRASRGRLARVREAASVDPDELLRKVSEELQVATTLWDLYERFDDDRQVQLLKTVFQSVVMSSEGIAGFVLRSPFDSLAAVRGPRTDGQRADYSDVARSMLDAA